MQKRQRCNDDCIRALPLAATGTDEDARTAARAVADCRLGRWLREGTMIGAGNRLTARRKRRVVPGLARLLGGPRPRRRDRSGVDQPGKWRSRRLLRAVTVLTGVVVLIFILWLAWVAYLYFVRGGPSGLTLDPDRRCAALSFSCGVISNVLASGVLLALASSFVLRRLFGLQRRYRAKARNNSRELVPTAGAIIDQVVGRDELCKVVMADLHDRGTRPHVLVGGVGTGKTAVLVRLTEFLAEKHAIPVPIRLRDAATDLDFENLARDRFLSEVNPGLFSSAEGETIWRRLRRDGKIIVLADGLEEALVGTSAEPERDNIIRAAIRKAHQQHLPLVIASRPHDPLRATEAAILMLEPLSYEAALAYIGGDGTGEDERRLAWIVETADVVEAPLYLQIARELQVKGLLEPTSAGQHGVVDTRGVDRSKLRLGLLETWERALIYGHLREEVPLNRAERHAAVEQLSALACVGLKRDRLEVEFDDLPGRRISAEVQRRLAKIDEQAGHTPGVRNIDVRLAAAWAAQLELVELRGNSVRFPHSLMQAYLGSRLLDAAWLDPAYRQEAMQHPQPGREFLIALVLRSRAAERTGTWRPEFTRREAAASTWRPRRLGVPHLHAQPEFVGPLRQAAAMRDDNKVLDMYAAALEIDCVAAEPAHAVIAEEIKDRWSRIHAQDPRTLEEGKLGLVHRFGEAARVIDDRWRRGDRCRARPAYPQLYAIGCSERSYPVQLAAAQEIGGGGDAAYQAVRHLLAAPCQTCQAERVERPATGADRLARGPLGDNDSWRASIMSAWLAPMLVGSVGGRGSTPADKILAAQAQADLARWLRHVAQEGRKPGEEDLPISLEIALAQGFKYAANRLPTHPDALREARMYLAEQALEMLKGARYWFSQLTLIHALCLLNLSEGPKQRGDEHGAKPEAIVQHWLDVAGRERDLSRPPGAPAEPHPFVREAAMLVVLALKTGRPQRYCWIDESGVVGQVGSRNLGQGTLHRRHRLWIPPSAGWTALNGRTQQLVADVLLLLNLAERGEQPSERERRLKRSNRHDLPPCITHYRDALDPGRTVGTAVSSAPGTSCVDGCVFELCPYPPKGVQPRVEMSEAFCRRQLTLLTRNPRNPLNRRAPWQQMRPAQLTRFWVEMADRARGPRPRSAAPDRSGNR
jgi:hypothetical protein